MYAGHAALALILKSRDRRVPLVPLVLASYGPDWLELVLGLVHGRAAMRILTHGIPVVVTGALIAALLYSLVFHRPGARWIVLAWLLHWPADFMTALKPLFRVDDLVGLDLYSVPWADFLLEGGLVAIGCVLYARALAPGRVQRRWVAGAGLALAALQGALDFGIFRQNDVRWNPKLSLGSVAGSAYQSAARTSYACLLHLPTAHSQ